MKSSWITSALTTSIYILTDYENTVFRGALILFQTLLWSIIMPDNSFDPSKFEFINDDEILLINSTSKVKNLISKIYNHLTKTPPNHREIKAYNAYKESPFLNKSTCKLELNGIIDRDFVMKNEINQRIEEIYGTMFYFKERTKEFAEIAGLDSDSMRMAFGEGLQNILEHGKSNSVEINIIINNLNSNDTYMEMSFKHYMPEKDFYSLKEADINADTGISNFESSRGRGEFLMREIMDERKFINGVQKIPEGKTLYFFKRIMRKYLNPKPRTFTNHLTDDFKNYIDSLQNYKSALFVRMDYFSNKKEIVISEAAASNNNVISIMENHNYKHKGFDSYRNIKFSFWESNFDNNSPGLDYVVTELEKIIAESK